MIRFLPVRTLSGKCLALVCVPLVLFTTAALSRTGDSRGIAVVGTTKPAPTTVLAQPGHALLIGASRYESPRWPDLDTVPVELQTVGDALRRQGFKVHAETDLPSADLVQVVRDFIAAYGSDKANRLVFYFSGHGYSRDNGNRGYFVPVDSPFPRDDEIGFLKRAVDMNQVIAWARQLEVNQALFVFDSCFSGTVFLQRGSGGESLLIQKLSTAPVRAFITAGTAGETVPARSDFAVAFAEALNDGLADSNRDGYSTGTELGVYLQSRIGPLGQQTPWFGKIPDPALAQGDFVFRSGRAGPSEPSLPRLASLTVVSSPAGASVYVDGQLEGISPVTLTNLPTGRRRIELRADGFTASQTNVELQSGDSHTISADLKPVQNVGRLTVTSNPEFARITFVDSGRDYQPGMELPQGNYSLRITATDFKSRDVLVKMFESDVSLFVDLAPETARVAQLGERGQRSVSGLPSIPLYGSAPRTPTCFARNTMGASFWWNGPDLYSAQWQAIRVCQMSTPPGAFCQLTSCQ